MTPEESCVAQVADAYEHLYDTVYLRTHPLTRLVCSSQGQDSKEIAWQLHHLLLDVIDELDPGQQAPAFSREWRRHRLMVLRYCDGLRPHEVADRLAISERSYYRELRDAIEAIASLLAERNASTGATGGTTRARQEHLPLDRMSMLRMEAARLASEQRQAALGTIVASAVALVRDMCHDRGIAVDVSLSDAAATASVSRNALRQVLLSAISHIIQSTNAGRVTIVASADQTDVDVVVTASAGGVIGQGGAPDGNLSEQRLAALCELAEAQGIRIVPVDLISGGSGYQLRVPRRATRTVLVADDNDDILQLFDRYLSEHGYSMLAARTGAQAIALVKNCLPDAITLDLMMPEQDGWDVLVTLTNHPDTQHLPIIVCSVLSARALSLSLGASLFLEKPVSEQALLSALAALGL